jgi:co-chaperonin GroES (HSP10)
MNAEYSGVSLNPKFQPVQYKVVVRMDKTETVRGKIIIPETVADREQIKQDKGTLIAFGGMAFSDFGEPKPKLGDRVLISRHAGYRFCVDEDNERIDYRVVNDKDISLILTGELDNG